MTIKVKPLKMHTDSVYHEAIEEQINIIQTLIDGSDINYKDGFINYLLINGNYKDIEKQMSVTMLIINKLDEPIVELQASCHVDLSEEAQVDDFMFTINHEEMGVVEPDEAFIISFDTPVRGLKEDKSYYLNDADLSLSDIGYSTLDQMDKIEERDKKFKEVYEEYREMHKENRDDYMQEGRIKKEQEYQKIDELKKQAENNQAEDNQDGENQDKE